MTLVTEKPEGLPTEPNDLDNIDVPDAPPEPANLLLGNQVLLCMDAPPEPGQYVKLEVTLRTRKDGRELLADGTYVHFRAMSFISAKVTADPFKPVDDTPPPPDPEQPQPGLFDHGGDPSPEASGADGDEDQDGEEPPPSGKSSTTSTNSAPHSATRANSHA
jgi:hypothetical protein